MRRKISNLKVSVVIPTYNGGKYLRETITSVMQNTSPEYELEMIVLINASTDETESIVAGFHCKELKVIRIAKLVNVDLNWSMACTAASGKYIKLLCDDDVLLPNSLVNEIKLLEQNIDVVAITSTRNIIGFDGRILFRRRGFNLSDGVYDGNFLIRKSLTSGTNLFGEPGCINFRRDHLIKFIPWNNALPFVIDLDMYLRAFEGKKVLLSKKPVMNYRVHPSTASYLMRRNQSSQLIELFKSNAQKFGLNGRVRAFCITTKIRVLQFLRIVIYFYLRKKQLKMSELPY